VKNTIQMSDFPLHTKLTSKTSSHKAGNTASYPCPDYQISQVTPSGGNQSP